jgi:hypothetical protein
MIASLKRNQLLLRHPEAVNENLSTVLEADVASPAFSEAYSDLLLAANPDTIISLAPRMFVDEPFVHIFVGSDVGAAVPKSYAFSTGIMRFFEASNAFDDDVRAWAKASQFADAESSRQEMRQWFKDNEDAFRTKDYGAVKPGQDIATDRRAAMRDSKARIQAYADSLRAQGKDPNDLIHWQNVKLPPVATGQAPSAPVVPIASPASSSAVAAVVERHPPAGRRNGSYWPWAVGILVLVVVATFALKRKA